MHSAEQGKSTLGIPQKVGAEFVAGQTKGALKGLPERVKKPKRPRKNGQISDRAHERMQAKRSPPSKDYGGRDGNNIPAATA
jgi:hypothetical protein